MTTGVVEGVKKKSPAAAAAAADNAADWPWEAAAAAWAAAAAAAGTTLVDVAVGCDAAVEWSPLTAATAVGVDMPTGAEGGDETRRHRQTGRRGGERLQAGASSGGRRPTPSFPVPSPSAAARTSAIAQHSRHSSSALQHGRRGG